MKLAESASTWLGSRTLFCATSIGIIMAASRAASAAEYYVATTGDDANPGSLEQPFATLQKGVKVAAAGDTVFIRGGTYKITTPAASSAGIQFSKSGTSDTNRIKYWAYPGEVPIFDFSGMTISTSAYTHGFGVSGSYLHFKGLEICNVPMNQFSNNGVAVDGGSNDIFELLNMHHNSGNGIFIGKGSGGHLVLNCDAHDNFDATSNQGEGQNADGFGVHYQTSGAKTIIRGCRAWWNSDDGYDLINQEVPVIVENSWAMGNGYANYGTYNPSSGNGNGFKMGSSKNGVRHLVQFNVAWKNKASGFYANHSSGGNTWYNNTSYNNGTQYNMLASPAGDSSTTITLTGDLVHIMRNNIGFPNKNTNMTGVDTAFNSWDLNLTPASKDFASVSDPSMTGKDASVETSGALGPREADGSLPNVDFLQLIGGSQFIDKGTDVGLPFVGGAPDLGAYEYGAVAASVAGNSNSSTNTSAAGAVGRGGASTGGTKAGGSGGAISGGGRSSSRAAAGSAGNAKPSGTGGRGSLDSASGAPGNGGNTSVAVAAGGNNVTGSSSFAANTGGTVSTSAVSPTSTSPSTAPSTSPSAGHGGSSGTHDNGVSSGQAATLTDGSTPSSGCSCALGKNGQSRSFGGVAAILAVLGIALRRRRRD